MRSLAFAIVALFPALAIAASDEPIGPDEWRALTTGKTLDYHKDGELYGREYYKNEEGDVVFRFPNGQCAEGRWAYAEEKYCFVFGGRLHCFIHILRDGEIVVISLDDGSEQTVERIADDEPLACGEGVDS